MGQHKERRVAIIGGGIGGISAAVALRRFGIDVSIFERAGHAREVGAGMMLWPNATRVLAELGLLDQVLARSAASTHFLVRAQQGRILMDLALGKFEVPALCISRADLLNVLLSALPARVMQTGREFRRLVQTGDSVKVLFGDDKAEEFSAVIGADGIRSRVRAELFGESEPIYRGYTVWRGIAPYRGSAIPAGCNSETWGSGKRFGILQTARGKVTWYATANVPADHADARCGRKRELQDMFHNWHEPIPALLAATAETNILKNGARDCPPMTRWGKGLVTLLGDAAHPCTPNLGQGGGMAIEDGMVLAKCLAREPHLRTALRRYEEKRMRRTKGIQQRSLWIGYIGQWERPLFVRGRQAVTRMLPGRLIEHNLRRVYGYQTS